MLGNLKGLILSHSKKESGNMSFVRGDYQETLKNRIRFLHSIQLDLEDVVALTSQHSNKVNLVSRKDLSKGAKTIKTSIKADALITNDKGVYLFLLTADCLPIAVYDPKVEVIALIHASKINIEKIIKAALKEMFKVYKSQPEDLIVNIGPSIGPCHYEIDLLKIACDVFKKLSVPIANVNNLEICTFESDYFSHRKALHDSTPDYRFATVLGMRIKSTH